MGECLEKILYLVKTWYVEKIRGPKLSGRISDRCGEKKPYPWQCSYYKAEDDKYIIGDEGGMVKCWMGEEVRGGTHGEAYLQDLESVIQFLLDDMNVESENINLVSNRKDIIDWIHGIEDTNWESRFLRNKTNNLMQVFNGVQLIFDSSPETGPEKQSFVADSSEPMSRKPCQIYLKMCHSDATKFENTEYWTRVILPRKQKQRFVFD
ncbi:hypothetical protein PIB30_076186 [Stylosanthes scabra]|uniref:Uncharacterized protein n=1 Tax=Stylosanthes scabra TaxID=79078 RepID=A0ABU6XQS0_9FABA|nr:hypothetical protein [Stylosanthes scabra]